MRPLSAKLCNCGACSFIELADTSISDMIVSSPQAARFQEHWQAGCPSSRQIAPGVWRSGNAQSVYLSFSSTMFGVLSHGNYQVGLHQLAVKIEHVQCSVVGAVTGVRDPDSARPNG